MSRTGLASFAAVIAWCLHTAAFHGAAVAADGSVAADREIRAAATVNRVFFQGNDTISRGLWVVPGPNATPTEVGGPAARQVVGIGQNTAFENIAAFDHGILFRASDIDNGSGLWFSDGTTAGTVEIGGSHDRGVKGAASGGLAPSLIRSFGPRAVFVGNTAAGRSGFWATNGTASGTVDLDRAKGVYIYGLISSANSCICGAPLGGKNLFQGGDLYSYVGLWITDGTVAGTRELGGPRNAAIANVSVATAGFLPTDFYAGKTRVFFRAVDKAGSVSPNSLWVSDGTVGGTKEILGPATALPTGFVSLTAMLGTVGDTLLFSGLDSATVNPNGSRGLWLSNGTAAGTSELGGPGSAALNGGKGFDLSPTQIAVLGSKVVFFGNDPVTGAQGLWVTDKTVAGTHFLTSVAPNSQFPWQPRLLTAIGGGKALFIARDASNSDSLWVTDGSKAGTFEIGGLNNRGIAGVPIPGLATAQIVAAGGVGYFRTSIQPDFVWVSNGTAKGTHKVGKKDMDAQFLTYAP